MSQIKVKFFKTIGVPSEPEPNSVYFVENADTTVSMYVTDQDGVLTQPGNPEFVEAIVDAAIAAVVNAAPGTLDTLNELAEALGDDANFAATITAALAGKQPLSANLTTFSEIAPSANVQSLLAAASYAAIKVLLGLNNLDNVQQLPMSYLDTDGTLALNSDEKVPSQKAVNTKIAAEIANLIASAPGALDTLDELAAALGDDANFAATMTNALAGKQPLDGDLTAIAALTTTAFGRGLLELANQAALLAAAGAAAASHTHPQSDITNLATTLAGKVDGTAGVKVYRALLTQTGTNAPVPTVRENSLGGTVVWARTSAGVYTATLSSAFPAGQTFPLITPGPLPTGASGGYIIIPQITRTSTSVLTLHAYRLDAGGGEQSLSDDLLTETSLQILVYP